MPKLSSVKLGSKLYNVGLTYSVSQNQPDIILYIPVDSVASFVSGLINSVFSTTPISAGPLVNNQRLSSGSGEIFFEYAFGSAGVLSKFQPRIIVDSGGGGWTGTVVIRVLIQYPDPRGNRQIYLQTVAFVLGGGGNASLIFPSIEMFEVIPAGAKLLVGINPTASVGNGGVAAYTNQENSQVTIRFTTINDSNLIQSQVSRAT